MSKKSDLIKRVIREEVQAALGKGQRMSKRQAESIVGIKESVVFDGKGDLETWLKQMSMSPAKGEATAYQLVDGSKRWAARNKRGELRDFASKKAALEFRMTGMDEAKGIKETDDFELWGDDDAEKKPSAPKKSPSSDDFDLWDESSVTTAKNKITEDMKLGFEQQAEKFRAAVEAAKDAYMKKNFPNLKSPTFSYTKGAKYWRLVVTDGPGRSVYCFLDVATGDILKADGWKRPAKGARGNIFNTEMLKGVGAYGANYKRGGGNYEF